MSGRGFVFVVCGIVLSSVFAAEPQANEPFVAASFNVRVKMSKDSTPNTWEERLPRCRALIQQINADVIGLQEPLLFQVKALVRDSEYDYIGGGRTDFKQEGEYSCILYRRSRMECLAGGTFGLSETPDVPGVRSWNSFHPRIATWGLFRDRRTGREFVFCNTHLDNKSEAARREGIKLLVAQTAKHAAGKPLMVSGDFNARPGSDTYKTALSLLRDTKTISETQHGGSGKTFHGWGRPEVVDEPIDYIFVSPEFRVLSHRTDNTLFDGQFASDHYPVVVKMMLE